MFDSDEEFEVCNGQQPNKVVTEFLDSLPVPLRESAVPLTHFSKVGFVAKGSFGRVYKAKTPDGSFVALKKLSLHQMNNRRHELALKDSVREIQVLASLKHRNITQLYNVVTGTSDIFLAIELCPIQLLELHERGISAAIVKSIVWQLLTGLQYIHECNLIHRDIKIDNLMVKEGILKIGDFGSTVNQNQEVWTPQVVTLWYRPPEILLGCSQQTSAIDIWSAGCVMGELIIGAPLFRGHSELNQINVIVDVLGTPTEKEWPELDSLPVMECMSLNKRTRRLEEAFCGLATPATLNMIAAMLEFNPEKRSSAAECLKAEYFSELPAMADEEAFSTYCSTFQQFIEKKRRVAFSRLKSDSSGSDSPEEEICHKAEKVRKRLRLDS